jgi:hypothetical protein
VVGASEISGESVQPAYAQTDEDVSYTATVMLREAVVELAWALAVVFEARRWP